MLNVRNKKTGTTGTASEFNLHAASEIIVYFDDDCSTEFIRDYEVQLSSGEWKDMREAFRNRDIIPDDLNMHFREPQNDEERKRGWCD